MDEIKRWLNKAQHPETGPPEVKHIPGGFGHAPHFVSGGNGYGSFNVVTAQSMMAWALAGRCGLSVDTDRFQAAHEFIARGTNKIGYVWYADEVGGAGYADMGRTGASALAHYLSPLANEDYKEFAKLNARCIGDHPKTFPDTHACPVLGMVWTALGAAVDPPSFRKLMDYNRWSFSLAHCPDGTFYYQPNRDNTLQDFDAAPRLSATAATATVARAADTPKPVKVFILAGQSNMEGKAPNTLLDYQAEDPKTKDLFKHLRKDGKWIVRDDVFILPGPTGGDSALRERKVRWNTIEPRNRPSQPSDNGGASLSGVGIIIRKVGRSRGPPIGLTSLGHPFILAAAPLG